jgi:hypothetical protein
MLRDSACLTTKIFRDLAGGVEFTSTLKKGAYPALLAGLLAYPCPRPPGPASDPSQEPAHLRLIPVATARCRDAHRIQASS